MYVNKCMKANKTISLDVQVLENLISDVGAGNVSSWIEDQAKKLHESLEMEKKVIPREREGNVFYTNNPNKPLLILGAKETTLDMFTDRIASISESISEIKDIGELKKVMKNSKVTYDISRTKIRKLLNMGFQQ